MVVCIMSSIISFLQSLGVGRWAIRLCLQHSAARLWERLLRLRLPHLSRSLLGPSDYCCSDSEAVIPWTRPSCDPHWEEGVSLQGVYLDSVICQACHTCRGRSIGHVVSKESGLEPFLSISQLWCWPQPHITLTKPKWLITPVCHFTQVQHWSLGTVCMYVYWLPCNLNFNCFCVVYIFVSIVIFF